MFGNNGDPTEFAVSKMHTVDNHVDFIHNINNIIH